jgi:putative DNA primase/helicase
MKQFTDFNDLANKSVLGNEAIDRQVRTMVQSVIDKHSLALGEKLQEVQGQGAVAEEEKKVQRQELTPKRTRAVKVA